MKEAWGVPCYRPGKEFNTNQCAQGISEITQGGVEQPQRSLRLWDIYQETGVGVSKRSAWIRHGNPQNAERKNEAWFGYSSLELWGQN